MLLNGKMFCDEIFSVDFVNGFVQQNYDIIVENILENGLRSRKIDFINFMNRIFNLEVNYHTLTNENKANAICNAKLIYRKYRKMWRERKITELRDEDWEQYIGKYYFYFDEISLVYQFFRVDRVLAHRLGITHYFMDQIYDFNMDESVFVVEFANSEPVMVCRSFIDKVKFYEISKEEVISLENFRGRKN